MSVLPSEAIILIGIGGFQPVATSFEMSAFSSGMISAPGRAVAQRRLRRDVRLREGIDHVLAVGRDLRGVRAIVGRERDEVLAVEADLVEVRVVRVLSLLLADGVEPQRARRAIEPGDAA